MSVIRIRAADAASALNEVARRFGPDALILSTTQQAGFVEITLAQADEMPVTAPQAAGLAKPQRLPDLPPRLVLFGPPGAGVTLLAARLAALHRRRAPQAPCQLLAPRADMLAPPSALVAHARLLGLEVDVPLWPDLRAPRIVPERAGPQIIDLSGLGSLGRDCAGPLAQQAGAECWLVLPTGLHLQAQDRIVPHYQPNAQALVLTRADICPLTLEDRALPQRFGLPIALISQGGGLLDTLCAPPTPPAPSPNLASAPEQKEVKHVAARLF
jgi:hypothetical protein